MRCSCACTICSWQDTDRMTLCTTAITVATSCDLTCWSQTGNRECLSGLLHKKSTSDWALVSSKWHLELKEVAPLSLKCQPLSATSDHSIIGFEAAYFCLNVDFPLFL